MFCVQETRFIQETRSFNHCKESSGYLLACVEYEPNLSIYERKSWVEDIYETTKMDWRKYNDFSDLITHMTVGTHFYPKAHLLPLYKKIEIPWPSTNE